MMDTSLYVFPVIGGSDFREVEEGVWTATCHEVYGTAFAIGPNRFLTAGHVLSAARQHEFIGLGIPMSGTVGCRRIENYEILESHDIGIIEVPWERSRCFPWTLHERPMLEDVHVAGYPYAIDREHNAIGMRAFKGHVVSYRDWFTLAAVPRVYELSFQCPRGLSGAPLWTTVAPVKVIGVVLGNSITEMEVYSERETDRHDNSTMIYQKVEALHLGIAMQTAAIANLESNLLNGRIGQFLGGLGLLGDDA